MMKIQILFGVLFAVLLCAAPAEAAMKLESSEHSHTSMPYIAPPEDVPDVFFFSLSL